MNATMTHSNIASTPRDVIFRTDCRSDERWLARTLDRVQKDGCAIVENVLTPDFVSQCRDALYRVREAIRKRPVANTIIERTGGLNILRLSFKYDPFFYSFMEIPEVLEIVDHTVSSTAILHTQNGLILPPAAGGVKKSFENQWHLDFPRVLNGYMASINTLFAIDAFTEENGGTRVVPRSHQRAVRPTTEYLDAHGVSVECPAGSMLVFDSTLCHAAGVNNSDKDRLAVNNQFTRSYFKPQIDFVRALGDDVVQAQKPRTQQMLGWYTRVPTSLEEFFLPAEERMYRSNQG